MPQQLILTAPAATEALGRKLAAASQALATVSVCIYLHGDLGAGKTSLARGFLRGCGHEGRVPSPTYTLVEPYSCAGRAIYHLDLYRLQTAAELEFLGIEELTTPGTVLLIEWPVQGGSNLVAPDLEVFLEVVAEGRSCRLVACSAAGASMLANIDGITA